MSREDFSSNSYKRAGSNKSKQPSRLEKIKILAVKLQSGRNFHDIFKNEQALLRASRLEKTDFFFFVSMLA